MLKKTTALLLGCNMLVSPVLSQAALTIPGFYGKVALPAISATTLPQVQLNANGSQAATGAVVLAPSGNTLVINQDQSRAVIDWSAFNIGAGASVRFNQGTGAGTASFKADSSFAVLNRIHDLNPSQIYGNLTANGKVYLINQNGILFGAGSQINTHALIGSTMNLRDVDFLGGVLKFTAENYQDPGYQPLTSALYGDPAAYDAALQSNLLLPAPSTSATVSNQGSISATVGGSVYLIAPQVENLGSISAPSGAIGLIAVVPDAGINQKTRTANYDILIHEITDTDQLTTSQATLSINSNMAGGQAYNRAAGILSADNGLVGMYGRTVNQDGLIRAVTAVKKAGMIELLATDSITTGAASVTSTPVSDSSDTADQTFAKKSGSVMLSGLMIGTGQNAAAPAGSIDHAGSIVAPSGNVYLEGTQIVLEGSSRIDVSGTWVNEAASAVLVAPQLNTLNLRDDAGQKDGILLGATLSVDGRFGSSIGNISGYFGVTEQTAQERNTTGGSIYLGAHTNKFTNTGITDAATTQNLIVKTGAELDFAGGGLRFASGTIAVSKLLSGTTLYDISSAPQWLVYDKIVTVDTFSPAFVQGSNAGSLTLEARQIVLDGHLDGSATRGAYQNLSAEAVDKMGYQNTLGRVAPAGGTLTVGSLKKSPEIGGTLWSVYSDLVTDSIEITAKSGSLADDAPLKSGVTLLSSDIINAAGLSSVSLYANRKVVLDQGASISLSPVNYTLTTVAADGTKTSSAASATVNLAARDIDIFGSITVPGGKVTLAGMDNITAYSQISADGRPDQPFSRNDAFVALPAERVFLETGSSISVAGSGIDNSPGGALSGEGAAYGVSAGGSISISSNSVNGDGVYLQSGSLLDVSGGYLVNSAGKLTGGDAGKLSLSGANIVADGELKGLSLTGYNGGSISFTANQVNITDHDGTLPADLQGDGALPAGLASGLVISGNRLAQTGFTQLEFDSYGGLTVADGIHLAPSYAKLASPLSGAGNSLTQVSADLAGTTSLTLAANTKRGYLPVLPTPALPATALGNYDYTALLRVGSGALLESAPGGKITLSGPTVTILGELSAPAGAISVSAVTDPTDRSYLAGSGVITLGAEAVLSAAGYNKPLYGNLAGVALGSSALSGGSITLTATTTSYSDPVGSVSIDKGAKLDVSGSTPASYTYQGGDGSPVTVQTASSAGSIAISYQNLLTLDAASLFGTTYLDSASGAALSITRANRSNPMAVRAQDLIAYAQKGFDALTLKSYNAISFSDSAASSAGKPTRVSFARSLVLDAPLISAADSVHLALSAPTLTLTNSYYPYLTLVPKPGVANAAASIPAAGNATLSLTGGAFLDVTGGVRLSGFASVALQTGGDLRLSDRYYSAITGGPALSAVQGLLETSGNLTLTANRVYTTSQSAFEVLVDSGSLSILPQGTASDSPIYSAYSSLVLQASGGIDIKGYLAAPLGSIDLEGMSGRVQLEKGSTVTAAGSADVNLGSLDDSLNWTRSRTDTTQTDATNNPILSVSAAPAKSITINAAEVVVEKEAVLDVSGGGSISAYSFVADLNGSVSPISQKGVIYDSASSLYGLTNNVLNGKTVRADRYVILPDNSVVLPGNAVYLAADPKLGLKAGFYSLLPESYAFVPGALVVSSVKTPLSAGGKLVSQEGYDVVAGYTTTMGSALSSPTYTGYSVRSAADVIKEGHFETPKPLTAGNGGTVKIAGNTTILNGEIKAAGLAGYAGGTVKLSGKTMTVLATADGAGAAPAFGSAIAGSQQGTLQVAADALNGRGIAELDLGTLTGTDSITLAKGSVLSIGKIELDARNSITLETGSQLNAIAADGSGSIVLNTALASNGVATGGSLTVQQGAIVHASDSLGISADAINLQGDLVSENGTQLTVKSDRMYVVPDGYQGSAADANTLYLSAGLWGKFAPFQNITLNSGSGLVFKRDSAAGASNILTLSAAKTLTIDAGLIAADAGVTANLNGASVNLVNSGKGAASSLSGGSGSAILNLNAGDSASVNVGNSDDSSRYWNILLDGFRTVNLSAINDLSLVGVGTLQTTADVTLQSARVVTGSYSDSATAYKSSRFTLDAGSGDISIKKSSGSAGSAFATGGSLELKGGDIDDAGSIVVRSGQVKLTAQGSLTLEDGAEIIATGNQTRTADPGVMAYSAAGGVSLSAGSGNLTLAAGSLVDVSAAASGVDAAYGDAGTLTISAASGVASLLGKLWGKRGLDIPGGSASRGGSFTLDAGWINGAGSNALDGLALKLTEGGFDRAIDIRARRGDLTLSGTLKAASITLAADGQDSTPVWSAAAGKVTGNDTGNIVIAATGRLDASGSQGGGTIDLSARNNLTLASGSTILATGTSANAAGGMVTLKAGDVSLSGSVAHPFGTLSLESGSLVDVSGAGTGRGGTVYLRAERDAANTGVRLNYGLDAKGAGPVKGAAEIDLEAVKVYAASSGSLDTFDMSTSGSLYQETSDFMAAYAPGSGMRLLPGIEIRGAGNLTLNTDWDLSGWRFAAAGDPAKAAVLPGVLTLRAAGDLTLNANILDYSTGEQGPSVATGDLTAANAPKSWGLNLVAGADLNGGDAMATQAASGGKLTVGNTGGSVMVYTENAALNFASAGDTVLNAASSQGFIYNMLPNTLGTFSGSVTGKVGGNLTLRGGVIQTGTGNIELSVAGAVDLLQSGSSFGAIRSTGEAAATSISELGDPLFEYWNYQNGGSIRISAGGSVTGALQAYSAWDAATALSDSRVWSASYDASNATQGIATMGGGNLEIWSGGDVASQIGTFGSGDLRVFAAGDAFGRYLVSNGNGSLTALGNVGSPAVFSALAYVPTYRQPTLELMNNSHFQATAYGGMTLGEVLNPTLANANSSTLNFGSWNPTYGAGAQLGLTALGGGVTLLGQLYNRSLTNSSVLKSWQILPASVRIAAAGDILFYANTLIAPSPTGGLELYSGGNIAGAYLPTTSAAQNGLVTLQMSDMTMYGAGGFYTAAGKAPTFLYTDHGASPDNDQLPLHAGDTDAAGKSIPVVISAKSDIDGLKIITAKETKISAGGNLFNVAVSAQNILPTDQTVISAVGDIVLTKSPNLTDTAWTGIEQGGPGSLLLMAGGSINLGNSLGVRSVGNAYNGYLGAKGSDLVILAGSDVSVTTGEMAIFFDELRLFGSDYSDLLSQGKTAEALALIKEARNTFIDPMLQDYSDAGGYLSMVQSQISTTSDKDNIYLIAKNDIDVGRSTLSQNSGSTGIFTAKGGGINIFSGGDLNVNVSKVMTFFGGDITVWSDLGNVNAGRGSKTAVSAQPPKLVYDPVSKSYRFVFSPPSVGSGIRAVTYDPNTTPDGGLATPTPGDIYLFAPTGVIDAGEAGIAGGKVTLGATEVLNTKNITFSNGSVGVPSGSDSPVSLGALSGAGSVTENSKMIEQASGLGSGKDKNSQQANAVDDFMSRWLDVKIISFDSDPVDPGQGGQEDVKKKK
jgi:filamentous hemagglutinin